jgi:hypothetical protein
MAKSDPLVFDHRGDRLVKRLDESPADVVWAEAARLTRLYASYVVTERRALPVIGEGRSHRE